MNGKGTYLNCFEVQVIPQREWFLPKMPYFSLECTLTTCYSSKDRSGKALKCSISSGISAQLFGALLIHAKKINLH